MSSELRWAPFATQTRSSLFRYARRHPHVPSSAVAAIPSKASCTQSRYREASTPEARRRQGSAFRERVNRELRRNDPAGRRAAFDRRRRTVSGSCGKGRAESSCRRSSVWEVPQRWWPGLVLMPYGGEQHKSGGHTTQHSNTNHRAPRQHSFRASET